MDIILVHGIFSSSKIFHFMRKKLQAHGFNCHAPDLIPNDGKYGIEDLAIKVQNYIKDQLSGTSDFVLIGFSMGGIVSRYYLQYLGGKEVVSSFFSISTPHNGSYMAQLLPGKGLKQLRPKSNFLKQMKDDESVLSSLNLYSYWTPFDLSIVPSTSSYWDIAENKVFYSPLHPLMLFNTNVIKEITRKLN
jgi:triacylglycerol lipase